MEGIKMKIVGKQNEAVVFAKVIEEEAIQQIQTLCDQEFAKGSKIRVMPDVHTGKGCTIGMTMTIMDKIVPNIVGVDIGCGMYTVNLGKKEIDLEHLDSVVHKIPSGKAVWDGRKIRFDLSNLKIYRMLNDTKRLERSLGTLGGGNHFIEADRDEEGQIYLTVHSGSRHLGKEVTDFYIKEGAKRLKAQKKQVPYPLTWIEGDLMREYMADVKVVQEFAALNREIILAEILKGMKWKEAEWISSVHNYLESNGEESILRKGAISARQGEAVVIPVNMRDGIILGVGKGNPDWNESAPHGSGRRMRRDEVKKHYTVKE